ncbi:MAG TPA: hypothetical protein VHK06_01395 [Candidatus Limnocylindria bacterium]|nr:hypothetical protein [Candidatus Limnocylindria bacterium]
MRRLIGPLLLALALSLVTVGSALGHVHGLTPLTCLDTDNAATSGARRTETTPAWNTNGGPLGGVIPVDVGNASFTTPHGGRLAAPCD